MHTHARRSPATRLTLDDVRLALRSQMEGCVAIDVELVVDMGVLPGTYCQEPCHGGGVASLDCGEHSERRKRPKTPDIFHCMQARAELERDANCREAYTKHKIIAGVEE